MAYGIGALDIGAEDDISGMDIGAVSRRKMAPRSPYGNPIQVQNTKPRSYVYQVFGLGSATLGAPGATALNQVFQEPFRAERLVLVDSAANNSIVNSIFVGVKPQLANNASFPASMFGPGTFETRIAFDCGQPGQNFLVNVTMAAAGTISGGAFGSVIK